MQKIYLIYDEYNPPVECDYGFIKEMIYLGFLYPLKKRNYKMFYINVSVNDFTDCKSHNTFNNKCRYTEYRITRNKICQAMSYRSDNRTGYRSEYHCSHINYAVAEMHIPAAYRHFRHNSKHARQRRKHCHSNKLFSIHRIPLL